jgi:single-stranded-DNA-specific exonuclease
MRQRRAQPVLEQRLIQEGVHPVLARLYAVRGVSARREMEDALVELLSPDGLLGIDHASRLLADAIARGERLLIVADYDCDGATACAVGMRALRAFGADVSYLVPDRFRYGYGLTPEIVQLAATRAPRLIITVDNGIASVEGVAAAHALGMEVIVTDHHLPGAVLPRAAAIVNPNQPGCRFPSRSIAGVGVMFYVMLALRAELRRRGRFAGQRQPALADLLDLVALGTVADVVPLDRNNRVLVSQGLKRIRAGRMQPGVRALFAVGGRDPAHASTFDLGFIAGPRLNAAGRLQDMSLGIECLLAEDVAQALNMARRLDELNRERRSIESDMREQAERLVHDVPASRRCAVSVFDPRWHQGVIGILAGRLKDKLHRPVIAFAPGTGEELRGSGRSIAGLHLRDALDRVEKRAPGLLLRFGGHAAAAGLTLRRDDFDRFCDLFEQVVGELLSPADLERTVETDGPLETSYMSLDTARLLEGQVWGQGFPQPLFCDEFAVLKQRLVGEKHLKMKMQRGGRLVEALQFNAAVPLPAGVRAAYRLAVNDFNGLQNLQLVIEHWEPNG